MIFDVRFPQSDVVSSIQFADRSDEGTLQAHIIERNNNRVKIKDGAEFVYVSDAEHARNLVKALEKAISLGWLK